jgi:DMSO reductase iron-sulfur subunit
LGNQLGFLYNQKYCVGCQACETACKNRNKVDVGVRYRIVEHFEKEVNERQVDRYLSHACMHCEKPACAEVCPVKAYTKREDGIVIHDQSKCVGCGYCLYACPYQAPKMNPNKHKAEKCNLCYDLMDAGEQPACVRGCPLQILAVGELAELESKGAVKEGLEFPVFKTNPSIRFVPSQVK